ncbi:MerR family transcriptional regulator [Streptomyces sp. R302]|uniref:MerR family transcriptional regulator n=1 Tax=unclassified Streptomyces TaxID=2593676 RepID=UPI00145DAABA|nr:MerR family transcriptional regulator [Streptomyces sp. R301]NML82218.1 MerR family transcriptional regulator [Streptomyces sp. R302]
MPRSALTIGDFARATGLSAKALRRYDELGLLRPDRVDPYSGYRYYADTQTERARLIAWLRRIGMPLADVGRVCALHADDPAGAAREIRAYWASVEADTAARRGLAASLVERVKGNGTDMTTGSSYVLAGTALLDRGLVRELQQDAAHASPRLLAVADGYGPEGGRAARAAVEAVAAVPAPVRAGDGLDALEDAVRAADAVAAGLDGSGTTLTAALLAGNRLLVAHLGDSRAYLLRDGRLRQLTRDDTVVQELVDAGGLEPEEAAGRPDRAVLLKAVEGGGAAPALLVHEVRAGDRLLLCTDGLSALLPPASLTRTFASAPTVADAASALVTLAHASGAPDNLALAVAEVAGT